MNELQVTKTIAIYADYQGYSICVLGYDYENPVNYYVLAEITNVGSISHNALNESYKTLKAIHPVSNVIANNQAVADTILNYSPEVREYTPKDGYYNLVGLIEDERINFCDYASIFQPEIDDFSPEKNNHRLNAFFLGLTEEKTVSLQVQSIIVRSAYAADPDDDYDFPSVGDWTVQDYFDMHGHF